MNKDPKTPTPREPISPIRVDYPEHFKPGDPNIGPRQCTAHIAATGERCRKNPCKGQYVCEVHGGAIPLNKQEAKRRLLSLVEPALDALMRALECGEWPVVVRAATALLDRAGFGPQSKITVENTTVDYSELTEQQLVERAQLLAHRLQEQAEAAQATDQHVH